MISSVILSCTKESCICDQTFIIINCHCWGVSQLLYCFPRGCHSLEFLCSLFCSFGSFTVCGFEGLLHIGLGLCHICFLKCSVSGDWDITNGIYGLHKWYLWSQGWFFWGGFSVLQWAGAPWHCKFVPIWVLNHRSHSSPLLVWWLILSQAGVLSLELACLRMQRVDGNEWFYLFTLTELAGNPNQCSNDSSNLPLTYLEGQSILHAWVYVTP